MGIDVEKLLAEVSAESPCGEDLSYDQGNAELERAMQGTTEQQVGDSIVEAQDPDWKDIRSKCVDLLGRSKDLRVSINLTLALMMTDGLVGLRDGLALINGLIEKYWDSFWPQLDPEDDNDPLERLNIISSLAPESSYQDPLKFPQRILEVPLVSSQQLGRFSLRSVLLTTGELTPAGEEKVPDPAHIDGAFGSADADVLSSNAAAAGEIVDLLNKISANLGEKVGIASVPSLDKFASRVKQIQQLYAQKSSAGGGGDLGAAEGGEAGPGAPAAARGPGISGGISTRNDVVRALDMIVEYYRRAEPSSPVPLLMERAKRLATKNFMEIIQDMSPDAIQMIRTIVGAEPSAEEQSGY